MWGGGLGGLIGGGIGALAGAAGGPAGIAAGFGIGSQLGGGLGGAVGSQFDTQPGFQQQQGAGQQRQPIDMSAFQQPQLPLTSRGDMDMTQWRAHLRELFANNQRDKIGVL